MEMLNLKFGKLTVISDAGKVRSGKRVWKCVCECGKEKIVNGVSLRSGKTRSCGCLKKEVLINRNATHGQSKHPLYSMWCGMHSRCTNKNQRGYRWYGAEGIKICKRWENFAYFLSDMEPTWKPGLEIERVNGKLDYSKENCTWATRKQQMNNTRSNVVIEANGKSQTAAQWASESKVKSSTIRARIDRLGWTAQEAVNTPSRK